MEKWKRRTPLQITAALLLVVALVAGQLSGAFPAVYAFAIGDALDTSTTLTDGAAGQNIDDAEDPSIIAGVSADTTGDTDAAAEAGDNTTGPVADSDDMASGVPATDGSDEGAGAPLSESAPIAPLAAESEEMEPLAQGDITTQAELEAAIATVAAGGTVTLTQDIALSSSLAVPINKIFVLDGDGYSLTLAPGYTGRHISAALRTTTVFQNLTFDGGSVGGGVAITGSTAKITLTDCNFYDNTAANGGALEVGYGNTVNASNCEFSGNEATSDGGAVYTTTNSSLPVRFSATDCQFTSNHAGRDGGALYTRSGYTLFTITDCTFSSNTAGSEGGAIHEGFLVITDTKFDENEAGTDGGAIYAFMQGGSASHFGGIPHLTIKGGSFAGNRANNGRGGAILTNLFTNSSWNLTVDGTSFTDNYASVGYLYFDFDKPIDATTTPDPSGYTVGYHTDYYAYQTEGAARYSQNFTNITSVSQGPAGYPDSANIINNYDVNNKNVLGIRIEKGADAQWTSDPESTNPTLRFDTKYSVPLTVLFPLLGDYIERDGYVLVGFVNDNTYVDGYTADMYTEIDGYTVLNTDYTSPNGFLRGFTYLKPVWGEEVNVTYHFDSTTSATDPSGPFYKDQSGVSVLSLAEADETWAEPTDQNFMGWATSAGGAVVYQLGATITVTDDVDLYAVFSETAYTVTFVDWDGTILKTEHVAQGGDATPPLDPSRAGYTFTGWEGSYVDISADVTIAATYLVIPADDDPVAPVEDPQVPPAVVVVETVEDVVVEDAVIETEAIPTSEMEESDVPLAFGDTGQAWALVNLIMAVIGLILALLVAIYVVSKRSKPSTATTSSTSVIGTVIAIVMAITGVAVFLFTEDMTLPMMLIDGWTLLMAIILIVGIVGTVIGFRFANKESKVQDGDSSLHGQLV